MGVLFLTRWKNGHSGLVGCDARCTSAAHLAMCSRGTPHAVPTAGCGLHWHRAKSRDSSVSVVTRLWAGRSGTRFLARARCIFPLRCPKPPDGLLGPLSSVPLAVKLHAASGQSSASQRGEPGLTPGQLVWDFWCTKWHWDRSLSQYFCFSL
jgi:hypothetical protein